MKKSIITLLLFIASVNYSGAQFIECIGNTIEIPLDGYKNGTIQWQVSVNGNDWSNIPAATGTTLSHVINETGYFRARVNYGNCDFYSAVTYIQAFPATTASAGTDRNITNGTTTVSLDANTAAVGTGNWTITSGTGGVVSEPSNPKSAFTGILGNKYNLNWNITSDCSNTNDNVTVAFYDPIHFVTDYDGNVYNTVTINSQEWMAENLKTKHYNNGDLIGTTVPFDLGISSSTTLNYEWAYLGLESNVTIYGRLYTWFAATDSRSICPEGWHLPNDNEWLNMAESLGGLSAAGGKLKETGTTHWISPNNSATNESGFTALPGGNRSSNGTFSLAGSIGGWWSSSEQDWEQGKDWYLYNSDGILRGGSYYKTYGVSVRCVKD